MAVIGLGERIKQARKAKGFTQQYLAEKLETTSGYISEIEADKKVPGGEFLISLKRYLGVSTDWLLTGAETKEVEVYDKIEDEYVRKLLKIMRTKQEKTVTAIKQNLEAFLDNPDKEKETAPFVKKTGGGTN